MQRTEKKTPTFQNLRWPANNIEIGGAGVYLPFRMLPFRLWAFFSQTPARSYSVIPPSSTDSLCMRLFMCYLLRNGNASYPQLRHVWLQVRQRSPINSSTTRQDDSYRPGWLADWLAGWPAGWLAGWLGWAWLAGWLPGWLAGWLARLGWLAGCHCGCPWPIHGLIIA